MHSTIGRFAAAPASALAVALVIAACGLGLVSGHRRRRRVTSKEPVERSVYGTTDPSNAPGPDALAPAGGDRSRCEAGRALPRRDAARNRPQRRAHAQRGVRNRPGDPAPTGPPSRWPAPRVTVRKGDALVETESVVHYGANSGRSRWCSRSPRYCGRARHSPTPVGDGETGATQLHLETTLASQSRTLHQVGAAAEKTYGWNLLTGRRRA